jgi:hypothetical protein
MNGRSGRDLNAEPFSFPQKKARLCLSLPPTIKNAHRAMYAYFTNVDNAVDSAPWRAGFAARCVTRLTLRIASAPSHGRWLRRGRTRPRALGRWLGRAHAGDASPGSPRRRPPGSSCAGALAQSLPAPRSTRARGAGGAVGGRCRCRGPLPRGLRSAASFRVRKVSTRINRPWRGEDARPRALAALGDLVRRWERV